MVCKNSTKDDAQPVQLSQVIDDGYERDNPALNGRVSEKDEKQIRNNFLPK